MTSQFTVHSFTVHSFTALQFTTSQFTLLHVHAPSVHAPSVHAPSVHAPSVHASSVHAPSVHSSCSFSSQFMLLQFTVHSFSSQFMPLHSSCSFTVHAPAQFLHAPAQFTLLQMQPHTYWPQTSLIYTLLICSLVLPYICTCICIHESWEPLLSHCMSLIVLSITLSVILYKSEGVLHVSMSHIPNA